MSRAGPALPRHGKPSTLIVAAAEMNAQRHHFYLSEKGVWLCEHVPAKHISFPADR